MRALSTWLHHPTPTLLTSSECVMATCSKRITSHRCLSTDRHLRGQHIFRPLEEFPLAGSSVNLATKPEVVRDVPGNGWADVTGPNGSIALATKRPNRLKSVVTFVPFPSPQKRCPQFSANFLRRHSWHASRQSLKAVVHRSGSPISMHVHLN